MIRTVEADRPVRVSYRLSEAGKALEPAIAALGAWANRWVALPERDDQPA